MNYIKKTEVAVLHSIIPKSAHCFISNYLGYSTKQMLLSNFNPKKGVNEVKLEKIKKAFEAWKEFTSFRSFNFEGQFNFEQSKIYYDALTGLINSPEFQQINRYDKGRIIEEQNKIYKQLI